MNKILIHFMLVSFFSTGTILTLQAQEAFCATDQLLDQQLNSNQMLQLKEQQDLRVRDYLNKTGTTSKMPPYRFLPVVFHVIHQNGLENISNAEVQQGIDNLNEAFANQGYYDQGTGANTFIQFCLAETDPAGNPSTGINRVVSPLTSMTIPTDDSALKALSFWDANFYINIWVVKDICSTSGGCGVVGYATFPIAHGSPQDGVVLEHPFVAQSKANSGVLIHEMGHYLGLYHTFEAGCTNNDCQNDGDKVCDTPPDGSTAPSFMCIPPNTCQTDDDDLSTNNPFRPVSSGGLGDQFDLINNYMDYGDLICYSAFTQGQADRMYGTVMTVRSSLLTTNVCNSSCSVSYNAYFSVSPNPANVLQPASFTNTSTGGDTYEWLVDGTPFATTANPSYTFNTVGTYDITLNVSLSSDTSCLESYDFALDVICPVTADATASVTAIYVGDMVSFTNNSTGATSFEWIIDNTIVASTNNHIHTFNTPGYIEVFLVAHSVQCSDTTSIFISVNIQEDCLNGIDDDGDGYVDCYDSDCICSQTDCSVEVSSPNFTIQLAWKSHEVANKMKEVVVGNLDPHIDSIPEIITAGRSNNEEIVILQGDGSNANNADLIYDSKYRNLGTIADIDNNGIPEYIVMDDSKRIKVFTNYTKGANPPMTLAMTSNTSVGIWDNISVADFDQDGTPEVYANAQIYSFTIGSPGTLTRALTGNGSKGRKPNKFYDSKSVAVDILSVSDCNGDPDCEGLELVAGNQIYSIDLDPNDGDPMQMKIQVDIRTLSGNSKYIDGFTQVADVNLDGQLDVVVHTENTLIPPSGNDETYMLYVYDKNGILGEYSYTAFQAVGIPCISNVYDDTKAGFAKDLPEILFIHPNTLVCFNLNAVIANPSTKTWWNLNIDDHSGLTGLVTFDFNGDNINEIVYRGQESVRIMYGGAPPFPVGVDYFRNWATYPVISPTAHEFPIVADVDNDNQVEIVCTGSTTFGNSLAPGSVFVFEADTTLGVPWLPCRPLWNQSSYFYVNINDDLTVPQYQQAHHLEMPPGSGNYPFNSFQTQIPLLDNNYQPINPVADAIVSIDSAVCQGTDISFVVMVCNDGDADLPAGFPITFYSENPTGTATSALSTVMPFLSGIERDSCASTTVTLPSSGLVSIFAVANDDATLTPPFDLVLDFPLTSFLECEFLNNIDSLNVANQSGCGTSCPDLSPVIKIIPGNVSGASPVSCVVKLSEVNGVDTDMSSIFVRMPSDPRLLFVWLPGLTQVGFDQVQNADWNYLGDNGIIHEWIFNSPSTVIPAYSTSAFGFNAIYDPQGTNGQTTITATIVPLSGGECVFTNNSDSELLIYFN